MGFLKVVLFLISIAVVSCTEYVPVLLWGSQTTDYSHTIIPALSKLSSNEFTDYLVKRIQVDKPLLLVFMEENISVEDFSWKDLNGNGAFPRLSNITRMADDVAFIPSVHEPYKSIKKLKNHGYTWRSYGSENFASLKDGENSIFEVKLEDPDYLEDRPDMLKKHDEKIAKIYNKALSYKQNVMAIYTGSHTSWIDMDLGRFKREDQVTNGSSTWIISDAKNTVRMATIPPIIYKNGTNETHITKILGDPTIKTTKDELIMRVRFKLDSESVSVDFKFTGGGSEWWSLTGAELPTVNLTPTVEVGGPVGFSFFCNPVVAFNNGNLSLIFENFQVQPLVGEGNDFGPVIHCINYFSVGILSGLVIVFILSVVLAWGITMIMDINTNDRFDDPKGKTITISACD